MAGTTKLMTAGGGGVALTPASSIASDVTVNVPSVDCTLYGNAGTTITSGTAVASTSGTSIDFTSIPSWVKRITVMLNGVSTNGNYGVVIQLGDSGGPESTGYNGTTQWTSTYVAWSSYNGVMLDTLSTSSAGWIRTGVVTLSLLNSATNLWAITGSVCPETANGVTLCAGTKATSATLDRIRITTASGTDTFDAGSVNILYE